MFLKLKTQIQTQNFKLNTHKNKKLFIKTKHSTKHSSELKTN